MQIPIHDDLKLHFIQNRGKILENFQTTANAWNMFLRSAVPDAGDEAEFQEITKAISEFHAWVEREMAVLEMMSMKEQVQSFIDTNPSILDFLKPRPGEGKID